MSGYVAVLRKWHSTKFALIKDSMLQSDDLPLADVIDSDEMQSVFEEHGVNFGSEEDAVYTPAITLWALISQVFFKGEMRSCKAAVGRIASLWAVLGRVVCSTNTGAYCRARLKVKWQAVRDICYRLADLAEAEFDDTIHDDDEQQHEVIAGVQSVPTIGRIVLVDGFTVTAADTPANQEEFPQNPAQKEGLGFPIIRGVSLISMITGLLVAFELGPYAGKQTGETALLWKLLGKLKSGDTLVADAYYCTYWLIAACHAKGVHVVMKNHDKREDEPDDAKRISKYQRRVLWHRPQRPDWMSQQEYDALPEEVEIRLVDLIIDQRGFRSSKYTVATTILNTKIYSRQWITNLYRGRWLVELDIRSIKCSLSMDIIRAKSPDMVRTEIWSCLLAYNLIRLKMLQAAAVAGRMPRSLSFTATMQSLATTWTLAAVVHSEQLIQVGLEMSSDQAVAQRPDRVEPRANKRRPKLIALLTKPRQRAIAELKQTT